MIPRPCTAVLAVAFVGLAGCARADRVADRHAQEMRDAIAKVQADQDRMSQRLGALEMAAEERTASSRGEAAEPRAQRVVTIGDGREAAEDADPNDASARPEIRVVGPPGAAPRPARGKTGRGEAHVEPSASDESLRADRPSALDPEAKRAYDAAHALVEARQYDRALEALSAFLVRWPDHPYVENAMYWRGECYYAKGEYLRAAENFEGVLSRFGGGKKAPDALLKIGMCHDRLGSSARADEYWERLKRDFPRSDAAKRIPNGESSRGRSGRTKGPKESP